MRIRSSLLLAALILGSILVGTAAAQPGALAPPSGPVQVDHGPRHHDRDHARQPRARDRRARISPQVRAALIARFDRNGDGRLTGPERRRAKKFVMRHRHQRRADRN